MIILNQKKKETNVSDMYILQYYCMKESKQWYQENKTKKDKTSPFFKTSKTTVDKKNLPPFN